MGWRSIGSISPGFDWVEFGEAVVGSTVVRAWSTYAQQPNGPALLRMNFYVDGIFNTQTIYPSPTKKMIEMRVPRLLIDKGIVVWYPAVKLARKTRPHVNDAWQLHLEELI
jgi:hypothetical protein